MGRTAIAGQPEWLTGEGGALASYGASRAYYCCAVFSHGLGRLLAWRTFLRRRSWVGVTSTNSSSAMNSMACSRLSVL
jgi:protein-S-isoprenylcysteine O-methyltransferase Ste14